jgi:UDP-N-acetylglucosamine diphosphorylase/glucosamine-1-phosphate N-acetyltransferase
MMNLIFFDDENRNNLQPFTLTRTVADIRVGILTIREKWENHLSLSNSFSLTQDYLSQKYPFFAAADNLFIAGSLLPNKTILEAITQLQDSEAIAYNGEIVAARLNEEGAKNFPNISPKRTFKVENCEKIEAIWNIFQKNEQEIKADFKLLVRNRKSAPLSPTNLLIGNSENLFIEKGAKIEGSTLNCEAGPIYVGSNAEIMEGTLIRGAFALLEGAQTKLGCKIYGATTIGPHCKVGGELNNVVLFGYSNKAHDGFLGNSVIGEWCNLGADTNSSNLKNNYDFIKIFDFVTRKVRVTNTQFCGLFMGDHSKCGINSMFNSGTVVGIACNLFGTNYMRNFIESFSYGGPQHGYEINNLKKVLETAQLVYQRRGIELTTIDKQIIEHLFSLSHPTLVSEKK